MKTARACHRLLLALFAAGLATAFSPNVKFSGEITRRGVFDAIVAGSVGITLTTLAPPASARLEAVNRPDLLPKETGLNVIQTEKFLTSGQAKRLNELLSAVERDTGYRVRVLCQNYPNTPGLAIRDYWDLGKEGQKDDVS